MTTLLSIVFAAIYLAKVVLLGLATVRRQRAGGRATEQPGSG